MNEKLENLLGQLVEKDIEAAEKTGEFIIEQAPLLLQEFYRWHIAKNILMIVVCVIVLSISIWGVFRLIRYCNENDNWGSSPVFVFFIFPL